jgi:hypothetical protein
MGRGEHVGVSWIANSTAQKVAESAKSINWTRGYMSHGFLSPRYSALTFGTPFSLQVWAACEGDLWSKTGILQIHFIKFLTCPTERRNSWTRQAGRQSLRRVTLKRPLWGLLLLFPVSQTLNNPHLTSPFLWHTQSRHTGACVSSLSLGLLSLGSFKDHQCFQLFIAHACIHFN